MPLSLLPDDICSLSIPQTITENPSKPRGLCLAEWETLFVQHVRATAPTASSGTSGKVEELRSLILRILLPLPHMQFDIYGNLIAASR